MGVAVVAAGAGVAYNWYYERAPSTADKASGGGAVSKPAAALKKPKKAEKEKREETPEELSRREKQKRKKTLLDNLSAALNAVERPHPPAELVQQLTQALHVVEAEIGTEEGSVPDAKYRLLRIHCAEDTRGAYSVALEDLQKALHNKELGRGREALQRMLGAQKELQNLGEELPVDRLKCELDERQAKAQLDDLETIVNSRVTLEAGRELLQDALARENISDARKAIWAINEAEGMLRTLHEDYPADNGLVSGAIQSLKELEKRAMEEAHRKNVRAKLEAAIMARSPSECATALAEARNAGVELCPILELAEVLANGLVEMRKINDLSADDLTEAMEEVASEMDEAQLRAASSELAGVILRTHALPNKELEAELNATKVALFERCAERMQSLKTLNRELESLEEQRRAALEKVQAVAAEVQKATPQEPSPSSPPPTKVVFLDAPRKGTNGTPFDPKASAADGAQQEGKSGAGALGEQPSTAGNAAAAFTAAVVLYAMFAAAAGAWTR